VRLETTKHRYRVDRRQISFIRFILEAYDNVAVMTTLDSRQAVIQITIAPGCEAMVAGIVDSFAGEFDMIPVDDQSSAGFAHDKNGMSAGQVG
jgi:uncharacterized protein DUF4911